MGEFIEFVTMELEEYLRLKERKPFIYEVERYDTCSIQTEGS
jgi:hypothetical protein